MEQPPLQTLVDTSGLTTSNNHSAFEPGKSLLSTTMLDGKTPSGQTELSANSGTSLRSTTTPNNHSAFEPGKSLLRKVVPDVQKSQQQKSQISPSLLQQKQPLQQQEGKSSTTKHMHMAKMLDGTRKLVRLTPSGQTGTSLRSTTTQVSTSTNSVPKETIVTQVKSRIQVQQPPVSSTNPQQPPVSSTIPQQQNIPKRIYRKTPAKPQVTETLFTKTTLDAQNALSVAKHSATTRTIIEVIPVRNATKPAGMSPLKVPQTASSTTTKPIAAVSMGNATNPAFSLVNAAKPTAASSLVPAGKGQFLVHGLGNLLLRW